MEDDQLRDNTTTSGLRDEAPPPVKTPKSRKRRWALIVFGVVVVVPTLLMAAWTAIALNWHYSAGNRAGFIQKFSQKGWVCKTWEGELAQVNLPGASQEKFLFSVRDDSVAREITRLMGSRVSLEYEEHRGVPGSCFGETGYYITHVKALQ
jgi:hypothetical protein